MSKNTQLASAVVSAQADLLADLLAGGYLRIYSGAQPANADTAVTTQTLLVQLRFATPAAPPAVNGLLTFNALISGVASATGTATWCRALASDGATVVFDGTVGVAGDTPNVVMNSVEIVPTAVVSNAGFTWAATKAYAGL